MKLQKWLLTLVLLLMMLALAAGSVLAQDAPPESAGPTGLRVGFLLVGLGALVFLGFLKNEPNEDSDR